MDQQFSPWQARGMFAALVFLAIVGVFVSHFALPGWLYGLALTCVGLMALVKSAGMRSVLFAVAILLFIVAGRLSP